MVPINLIRMLSDNLNICEINKYTNMLCDDNHTQKQYGKLIRPLANSNTVEMNTYIYTPYDNINTVPKNINLYTQWLLQPY